MSDTDEKPVRRLFRPLDAKLPSHDVFAEKRRLSHGSDASMAHGVLRGGLQ